MKLPHPHLVVLRSLATLALAALVAQAGWAAAFLGGQREYLRHHETGALVAVVVCVAGAVGYLVLRRSAGAVNVALAVALAALVLVQYALGEAGAVSPHVFLGVLLVMVATALTSWTYRHRLPTGRDQERLTPASRREHSASDRRTP